MKAISLHQPWASLCVTRQAIDDPAFVAMYSDPGDIARARSVASSQSPMIKQFETRSWPCPPNLIGSRIALHATKRGPIAVEVQDIGDWQVQPDGAAGFSMRHVPTSRRAGDGQNVLATLYPAKIGKHYGYVPLPLGAIVGSAVVEACYPIVSEMPEDGWHKPWIQPIVRDGTPKLRRNFDDAEGRRNVEYILDQVPYGDYSTDGKPRYAWLLTDAAPTTERCPWCWGGGMHYQHALAIGRCPVCSNKNRCDPIPARGHQRIWNWQP